MNRRATSMKTPRPVPVAAALIAGMVLAPSGLRWQPVGRRRPVTECRLRVGGCRLGLHACSRCAELSRPQQQRNPSEDRRTGSPCRDLPVSGIPECLPGHASLLRQRIVRRPGPAVLAGRRLTTGTGAADDDARADDRPLHARTRHPRLARPHHRPAGGPVLRSVQSGHQPQCLRAHGVPNWPDPTISAKGGRPVFDLTGAGIDPQSADTAQVLAKEAACRHQVGGSVPNLPTT